MDKNRLLQGKVAIVTGGAGSLGLAIAQRFLAEGASVMLADQDRERLAAVKPENPGRLRTQTVDVRCHEQVVAMVRATLEHFGGIDVLVSNAGNMGPIAPLAEYPEAGFDEVLAVHVKGAFLCCRAALPVMRRGGSIIITSSVVGVRGDPGPFGYIAAKHAQVGLMRAVAKEAARQGVRVNTLHPGPIDNVFQRTVEASLSPMLQQDAGAFFDQAIPLGRHGTPDEVAGAALFLASELSSFVTGTVLMADGGMTA